MELFLSGAMTGLIWMVQLVHYPGFIYVNPENFASFHRHHVGTISLITAPLMVLEAGIALWMVATAPTGLLEIIIAVIIALIWVSTFFIQVPLHSKLVGGKNDRVIQKLVQTNWIRTVLWSVKALLVFVA